jgi:hypothetical protein
VRQKGYVAKFPHVSRVILQVPVSIAQSDILATLCELA